MLPNRHSIKHIEQNNGVSLTTPKMDISPKELLRRLTKGLPLDNTTRRPIFRGDIEVPNFKRMDITEQLSMLEEAKQAKESLKRNIKQQLIHNHEQSIKKSEGTQE